MFGLLTIRKGASIAQQLEVGVALVNNHSFTGSMPQFHG